MKILGLWCWYARILQSRRISKNISRIIMNGISKCINFFRSFQKWQRNWHISDRKKSVYFTRILNPAKINFIDFIKIPLNNFCWHLHQLSICGKWKRFMEIARRNNFFKENALVGGSTLTYNNRQIIVTGFHRY